MVWVGDDKQTFNALVWWAGGEEELSSVVSARLLSGLIRLKAKGSTLWKVLLTSTLIASTEYFVRPAGREND